MCCFVAWEGISPKMCILCVRVIIKCNRRSFEPFCVWILFPWQNNMTKCNSQMKTICISTSSGGQFDWPFIASRNGLPFTAGWPWERNSDRLNWPNETRRCKIFARHCFTLFQAAGFIHRDILTSGGCAVPKSAIGAQVTAKVTSHASQIGSLSRNFCRRA